MKRARRSACFAITATLLVSGCGGGSTTITGTLVGADGACLYVRGPGADATDLHWLRHLPADYLVDADGLVKPDGSHIRIGDPLIVSGALSFVPFDRHCESFHTLDATAVE